MDAVQPKRPNAARLLPVLAMLLCAGALSACGEEDGRTEVRPPVPQNVSVVIGQEDITASPESLGAGPLTFLVSNQSGAARTLRVEGPQLSRSIGPIQPEDTATLNLTAQPGELELAADAEGVQPALLTIGPERPSAQDQLQLP
jgi:hypothetical protein